VGYRTELESLSVVGESVPAHEGASLSALDAVLVGRSDPQDYVINGVEWGSQPDGVYAYRGANLKTGSQVKATFRDGSTKIFTVVGSYDINFRANNLYPPSGLLMAAEGFTQVAQPDSLTFFVQVPPEQVSRAAAGLGATLPGATVVNLAAYASRFMGSYKNMYLLAIAMAGLALLAGILLVANSVSLAMLDRRYEIGILKTSGYSRRQILSIFAVEYGLAGLLATSAGVLFVQGLLVLLTLANRLALSIFLLTSPYQALILLCGTGLTLLTVLSVTWAPTRLPPALMLNERNG
jgi:putative ABC transport system permease protein